MELFPLGLGLLNCLELMSIMSIIGIFCRGFKVFLRVDFEFNLLSFLM